MNRTVFGFCATIVLSLSPQYLAAQLTGETSDFSFRPKHAGYAVVGLGGVQGLRVGLKLNTTNSSSAELSIGTAPFVELSGLKATIFGTGYNCYLRADHQTTALISFLAGYALVTTTSDEYKGDLVLVSPTVGIDYSSERELNLFLRMGFAAGFAGGAKPKTTFTLDLGAAWRVW